MKPTSARRRIHGLILAKILVPLGVVLGILAYVAIAGSTGFCPTCTAIVDAVTGSSDTVKVAALGDPGEASSTGPIHQLVMADLSGHPVSLSQFAGRPMVLDVWATWCVPCRKARAALHSIAERAQDYGSIVSVSVDRGGAQVVEDYIRTKEGGSSPFVELVNTDSRFISMLKPFDTQPTIPKLVFVDVNGNIVDIEYGVTDPNWVLGRLQALSTAGSRG